MRTVKETTEATDQLEVKEQAKLLRELPAHPKISLDDLSRLKVAESSFDFWDNPHDAAYDKL